MIRSVKFIYLFAILIALAPAVLVADSASDDFNRPDSSNMGPDWSEQEGNTINENNMGKGSSGAWMMGWMYHTGFEGDYADSVQTIDFLANQGSENVALYAGLNPNTWGCVSCKLQDNDMDGWFDRVFFESAINAGNWGTLGVPVWYDLATPIQEGTMTLSFTNGGDTAVCEINGTANTPETFTADGILTFPYPIDGTNFGIGHYNYPYFDNWTAELPEPSPVSFTMLDLGTSLSDMTADASTFLGYDVNGNFTWTEAGGYVNLGGGGYPNCSNDGTQVCGNIMDGGYDQAALWLGGTSWQALGGIGGTSGSSMSTAYDISGDGEYVVGLGWVDAGTAHAFRYDAVNGMIDLGSLGGESSRANAVTDDGSIIVGWDQDPSSGWWRGAKWVDGVEELLAEGTYLGACEGVSSDGTWIVGDNHPDFMDDGWRWSEETGFVSTGTLSGWLFQGHNLDVSDDGKVVVGWSGYFMDQFATIWTEETGIVDLKQYLIDLGAEIPADVILSVAMKVSDDGTTIIGRGQDMMWNGFGFIATIPPVATSPLAADATAISAETGGIVTMSLNAGADYADRDYLVLGSISGTEPGTALPGGLVTLPLNWDIFTDAVWVLVNTPTFANFLGTLDADGKASAELNAPPLRPDEIGTIMHFAYCLGHPFDYVSNPVEIEIVP